MLKSNNSEIAVLGHHVEGLEGMLQFLKERLSNSVKNEKNLRKALKAEIKKSDELKEKLEKEQEKNVMFKEMLEESPSDTEIQSCDSGRTSSLSDPKHTFGTISTVLMQYKYDELCLANKRCVRAFSKKEQEYKEAMKTIEFIEKEVAQLRVKQKELNEKIQELCTRYLNYKMRKDEEIYELQIYLDGANRVIEELTSERLAELTLYEQENGGIKDAFIKDIEIFRKNVGDHVR